MIAISYLWNGLVTRSPAHVTGESQIDIVACLLKLFSCFLGKKGGDMQCILSHVSKCAPPD